MKKIKIFLVILSFSLLASCESNETETTSTAVADFSFTNTESLFVFTNLSEGATSYRWDLGDLSFYCEKENPSFLYTKVGGEIDVTLTAIDETGKEASVTKTITAPIVLDVSITIDGDFSDWEEIDYVYQEATGKSMQKIKMWGRGDFVSIYLEGNTAMEMEAVNLYINADNDDSTGFLSWQWPVSSGGDFLYQGSLATAEGIFYQHIDPAGGWGWSELSGLGLNIPSSGIVNVTDVTNAIEFSIPKSQLGTLGTSIKLSFSETNIAADFPLVSGTSEYIEYELPIESTGLCE